jgi:hypothetical protein
MADRQSTSYWQSNSCSREVLVRGQRRTSRSATACADALCLPRPGPVRAGAGWAVAGRGAGYSTRDCTATGGASRPLPGRNIGAVPLREQLFPQEHQHHHAAATGEVPLLVGSLVPPSARPLAISSANDVQRVTGTSPTGPANVEGSWSFETHGLTTAGSAMKCGLTGSLQMAQEGTSVRGSHTIDRITCTAPEGTEVLQGMPTSTARFRPAE